MPVDQQLVSPAKHQRQTPARESLGVPLPPICPQAVAAILRDGVASSTMMFPEGGGYKRIERWVPPQALRDDEIALARRYFLGLETYLAPAPRGELLARILALLSHYRLEAHSPQIESWIADDWAEDLDGYPMWAVDSAARIWRRTKRFKPQTGEIAALCEEAVASPRQDRDRLRLLVERRPTADNVFVARTGMLAASLLKTMP